MTRGEMEALIREYPNDYDAPGLGQIVARIAADADPDQELHLRFEIIRLRRGVRTMLEDRLVDLVGARAARRAVAEADDDAVRQTAGMSDRELRRWASDRLAGGGEASDAAEAARMSRVAVELISDAASRLRALASTSEETAAVAQLLLGRLTDSTHVSVAEAARIRRVSTKTIRNWVAKGILTLERVPGTRQWGIPLEQLTSGWLSREAAARLLERRRR